MTVAIPEHIGPYELGEAVGETPMGLLFRARAPDSDESLLVAVARDPDAAAGHTMRMRREALSLLKIAHPNLIAIRDVGALNGRLYVILEETAGTAVDAVLARERAARTWSWRRVLELYRQAGRGLAAAHGRAVVHGGLTPDSIRVADDGRVRVTDFALLRDARGERAAEQDSTAAPERIRGAPATVYGDQFRFAECLRQALRTGRWWRRLGIPFAVARALRRATAERPDERFPSMHELLHALRPRRWAPAPGHILLAAGLAIIGVTLASLLT